MEAVFQKILRSSVTGLLQLHSKGLIQFKVICGEKEWGDLEVVKEKPVEKKPRYYEQSGTPYGFMKEYVLKYLADLQPNEVAEIPYPPYDYEVVRSNAGAYASKLWGKGAYTTVINKDKQVIEIYRHPLIEDLGLEDGLTKELIQYREQP
jgi:hypothetical protein